MPASYRCIGSNLAEFRITATFTTTRTFPAPLDQEKKCFSDVRSNKGALMMLPGSSEEDHNSSANLADFLAILNVALWGGATNPIAGQTAIIA